MSDSDSDTIAVRRKPKIAAKVKKSVSKRPVRIESSEDDTSQSSSSEDEVNEAVDIGHDSACFTLPTAEEQPKIFVLCGSCASGKSHMLKYMMYLFGQKKHFKFGLCFTSTKFTGDYAYLPDKSVREFDMDYLESYIKHLRNKMEVGKKEHGKDWKLPHNFVIIDDSIGMVQNSGFFCNFIGTHRHTRTTVFLLSQLLTAARSVSTVVRANTSFAMMWPTAMRNAIEGLHKSYGQFYTYDEFKKKLDECRTRKFSCLVFKNSPDFTDQADAYCSIVAAPKIPDFQLTF